MDTLEESLPTNSRKQFRQGLATIAQDLKEQNGGQRPSVTAIMEEAQKIHGLLAGSGQQTAQAIMQKYE